MRAIESTPAGRDLSAGSDELLLVEVLEDWAGREHPGDAELAGRAVEAAIEALVGGASLFEALHVGRSAAGHAAS